MIFCTHLNLITTKFFCSLTSIELCMHIPLIWTFSKKLAAILDFWRPFWIFFVPQTLFWELTPWTTYVPSGLLLSQSEVLTPILQISKPTKWANCTFGYLFQGSTVPNQITQNDKLGVTEEPWKMLQIGGR